LQTPGRLDRNATELKWAGSSRDCRTIERMDDGARWNYLSATTGPCIITKVFWDYYKRVIYNSMLSEPEAERLRFHVAGESIECPTMKRSILFRQSRMPPRDLAACFQCPMFSIVNDAALSSSLPMDPSIGRSHRLHPPQRLKNADKRRRGAASSQGG
jgi:hypothetical protein